MKSAIKYISVFCLAFLLSGGIAYYAVKIFTKSAGEIILPELRGKNIIYVLETLTNMGLNAKLYGTQYDETHPRYAVISQDPLPGHTIKKGRDVVIYISKGKKENIVPDLRQVPLNQALILLEKAEFTKGHISLTYSSKTRKDSIISHYPEPFSSALRGTAIHLLVSRGDPVAGFIMPVLTQMDIENARLKLAKLNLEISHIISDTDVRQPYGRVLSHQPRSGSHVTQDTPITLVVNYSQKNRQMNPEKLSGMILLTQFIHPGFLKRHIRVQTDRLGPMMDYYDDFITPGEEIYFLIPTNKKTLVNIFIDQTLIKAITIDPWNKDNITGDLLWESLPLQFYPPISQNLEMN